MTQFHQRKNTSDHEHNFPTIFINWFAHCRLHYRVHGKTFVSNAPLRCDSMDDDEWGKLNAAPRAGIGIDSTIFRPLVGSPVYLCEYD